MRKFLINYMIPGVLSFFPLYSAIVAENENEASEKFIDLHPTWKICNIKEQ